MVTAYLPERRSLYKIEDTIPITEMREGAKRGLPPLNDCAKMRARGFS
jgi:hypothetical protein